jgi:hypothetical protein
VRSMPAWAMRMGGAGQRLRGRELGDGLGAL